MNHLESFQLSNQSIHQQNFTQNKVPRKRNCNFKGRQNLKTILVTDLSRDLYKYHVLFTQEIQTQDVCRFIWEYKL